eukprot:TRINITY_DN1001_c0_g4_i1.p1 TRINITY_DN1001_c0_g4~~TRINITY_DN1001_c0_g4_i1.p1  ORF type:complete len:415 (-),score=115.11 TRINITY_DN1001_c0_g4_i1:386-1495(-)
MGGKGGKGGKGKGKSMDGPMGGMGGMGGHEMNTLMQMAMMGMEAMGMGKGMGKGGKATMKREAGEKVYHGKVRAFNADRGFGFIFCEDIFNEHNQEVFVLKTSLASCEAGVGDDVCFFLQWSDKGQPQAAEPLLRLSSDVQDNLVLLGTFKKNKKDPNATYGFIQSPQTDDFFGRDVYVNSELAAGAEAGSMIAFNATLNREGNPTASLVCACDETYAPQAGDLSKSSSIKDFDLTKGKGKGMDGMDSPMDFMSMLFGGFGMGGMGGMGGWGKGGKGMGGAGPYGGKGKGTGTGKKPTGTGQWMNGVVKSFNPNNNYGFVSCDEVKTMYGTDVFCGGNSLLNYPVGTQVVFQLAMDEKGRPNGIDITTG